MKAVYYSIPLALLLILWVTISTHLPSYGNTASYLPNSTLTPGATNPDVTQANINQTICVKGWTATIRPPAQYTTALKIKQIPQYGYADTSTASYEEDHLISLELGGNPTDPKNLWPQKYTTPYGAHQKDLLENKLKQMVCANQIPLAKAQFIISTDWVNAYNLYILPTALGQSGSPSSATQGFGSVQPYPSNYPLMSQDEDDGG